MVVTEQFRSGIWRWATERVEVLLRSVHQLSTESEIGEFDAIFCDEENVLGFDVSMNEAQFVLE